MSTIHNKLDQLKQVAINDLVMGKDIELTVLRLQRDTMQVCLDHFSLPSNPSKKGGEI